MPQFFNRLLDLIRDHGNLAIALLAWVVAAEAVIIVLWARRAGKVRGQLEVARQAAENAQALAAATLASDELMLATDLEVPQAGKAEPSPAEEVELAAVAARGGAIAERHAGGETRVPQRGEHPASPYGNGDSALPAPFGQEAGWASAPAVTPVREDPGWTPAPLESPTQPDASASWLASPSKETAPAGASADTEGETWVAAPGPIEPDAADSSSQILLVEDDENVAKLYRLLLESRGYNVSHAADGLLALEEVERHRPDLILLDVMMPRMGGLDFLESLRSMSQLADVPVVILSNFRNPEFVERALALGALEYMVKAQTRPESFISAVPHWLRGRRAFSA